LATKRGGLKGYPKNGTTKRTVATYPKDSQKKKKLMRSDSKPTEENSSTYTHTKNKNIITRKNKNVNKTRNKLTE
jgi:hypothetical protein